MSSEIHKSDQEILQMMADNPSRGLSAVLDLYGHSLKTICVNILGRNNPQDTEECISDILMQLWQSASQIDLSRGSLRSYLYGIARHKAVDRRRKNQTGFEAVPAEDADLFTVKEPADELNISIEKPATVLHQTEGYAWGFEVLETEDVKGDNRLPMMLCADYSGELAGKNMKLQMEGLRGWYPAGEGAEEGTSKEYGDFCLKTEISLDYVKKSVVKDVNAAVSLESSPWIMKTVEISPISVILNFEADTAFGKDAEKKLSAKTADDSELVLVMKDGTRRCDWRGWSSNTVGDEAFIIYEASQVLHPEEIAAIEFNGETFSLQ